MSTNRLDNEAIRKKALEIIEQWIKQEEENSIGENEKEETQNNEPTK